MGQAENQQVIDDFRATGGRPGHGFENTPVVLLHHVGRRSGQAMVTPMMYLAGAAVGTPDTVYVFASAGGRPANPGWYYNAIAAGNATLEIGAETYPVTVTELHGDERDRVYAEQARRFVAFRDFAEQTAGVRVIPVLALRRR